MFLRLTRFRELGQLPDDDAIIAEFLEDDGTFDFEPSVYSAEAGQETQAVAEHCARVGLGAIHPRLVVDVETISRSHRLRAEQREDAEAPFRFLRNAHHVILGTQAEKRRWALDFVRTVRGGGAEQISREALEDYALAHETDPEWTEFLSHRPWNKMVQRARTRRAPPPRPSLAG